jgi:hypothetical protein
MTEQTAVPPTLPTDNAKPQRKWRWLKITVGTIAAAFLAIGILGSYNSPDLELVRRDLFDAARNGKVLEITNTGKSPLKVVSIKINDRTDCVIARLSFDDGSPLVPTVMKIGDRISLVSSCQIIRVSVETDQGSNTYSFNR